MIGLCEQVRPLLIRLSGGEPVRTVSRGRPNWIVRVDDEQVWVDTEKTRGKGGPEPIPIEWIEEVCSLLEERGEVSRDDIRRLKGRFRSALIFAILAQLPEVRHVRQPKATLRLS